MRSQARFKQDETKKDWTSFSELAVPGKDYFFAGPVAQENPGNKLDGTTRYLSRKSRIVPNFWYQSGKS